MAKVITTVLKFPADQAQKILEREDSRTVVRLDKSCLSVALSVYVLIICPFLRSVTVYNLEERLLHNVRNCFRDNHEG